MSNIDRLLGIGSDALGNPLTGVGEWSRAVDSTEFAVLLDLLARKNGFLAFESALLVFPTTPVGGVPGLFSWNDMRGWRRWYVDAVPPNMVFFAEDVFANQFGLSNGAVFRLNPESGELTEHSGSLDAWAGGVLMNYDYETGWSLAKQWQAENGVLSPGSRLLPTKPFVLGGDYVIENLREVSAEKAMESFGCLYRQIRSTPDGVQVTVTGWLER